MSEIIRVGIAQMNICKPPDKITTVGLGSCIGVVLYDELKCIAGLVHIMLPDSTLIKKNQNVLKFADTGIDALLEEMLATGANKNRLKAKIAGGARMFTFSSSEIGSIGQQNIEAVHKKLAACNIPIVSEDTGLDFGRTIVFDPQSFEMEVITAGKNKKVI